MTRTHGYTEDEVETELMKSVKDELVVAYKAVRNKGFNIGKEQEGYKIPEIDPDWVGLMK